LDAIGSNLHTLDAKSGQSILPNDTCSRFEERIMPRSMVLKGQAAQKKDHIRNHVPRDHSALTNGTTNHNMIDIQEGSV
jgi:hypothetical protein